MRTKWKLSLALGPIFVAALTVYTPGAPNLWSLFIRRSPPSLRGSVAFGPPPRRIAPSSAACEYTYDTSTCNRAASSAIVTRRPFAHARVSLSGASERCSRR